MSKNIPAALAALPQGCAFSLRTHPRNPNHHLWWNNGTWWLHATVHRPDYTKQRLRLPLETKSSCVRQVLQKGMEVLVEVGVLVGSRTGCAA